MCVCAGMSLHVSSRIFTLTSSYKSSESQKKHTHTSCKHTHLAYTHPHISHTSTHLYIYKWVNTNRVICWWQESVTTFILFIANDDINTHPYVFSKVPLAHLLPTSDCSALLTRATRTTHASCTYYIYNNIWDI